MHKYAPEDVLETFFAAHRKCENSDSLSLLRQRVKEKPEDLDARLALVGRLFENRSTSIRKHLIWLIDNHPRHSAHSFITLYKETPMYSEARDHWLRQLEENPNDIAVIFHAGVFFKILHSDDSARLFQSAADLDPTNEEFPLRLSKLFQGKARYDFSENGRSYARKAVQQMLIAIDRYTVPSTLDSYLLQYFRMELSEVAELAINHNLLEEARQLADLLINHQAINEVRFDRGPLDAKRYSHSVSIGRAILERIAATSDR